MIWQWQSFVALAVVALTSVTGLVSAEGIEDGFRDVGVTAVFPNNPSYANASKPFNLRFLDNHPAAVTYPSTPKEVSEIVKAARRFGLHVVARSGGHSYIANGLGGRNGSVVVDLSNMTKIEIDPASFDATIETGNRLGDIALALNDKGRAIPHGSCAYVGIGGHSGHGGFGFSSRMWGLTLDAVIGMDVVLANGTLAHLSKTQHDDLFWAMRGASSSFGIVTSIQVKTFAIPSFALVFQYNWQLTAQGAADGLGKFQEFVTGNIPPYFGAEIVLTPGNEEGNVTFGLTGAWYGPKDGLNATVQPYLDAMPPLHSITFSGNGTWIDNVIIFAGSALNTSTAPDITDTFYAKSLMVPEAETMNDAARLAMMTYLAHEGFNSATGWFMQLELYGGSNSAINAVPFDETAFAHRNKMLTMQFYTQTHGNTPPFPPSGFTFLNDLVAKITSAMPADWPYGAYVNYIDDRLQDWQKRYYGAHYPRLEELKKKYDPTDLFKFPLAIEE